MVITIGREYGSGGKYIGERLAEELNLKLYDKELLNKVAEESGMDLDVLEQMDEKQEESFWYTFAMSLYQQDSLDTLSEIPSNEKIFIEQAKIIEELAKKEQLIEEVKKQCINNNLTEYLKTCSLDDIKYINNKLLADDIIGINATIFDAILTELEYRSEEKNVSKSPRK